MYDAVRAIDPELADALIQEMRRQNDKLEMIASENFVSAAVCEAQGSVLTNKYAEGYPGRRYYGGCEFVDIAERLAIERAKKLFNAEHANVQPHSGSQANQAVYLAALKPGDTVLGMSLSHGGHLTHGSPVNLSGMWFRFVHYGVDPKTERIDYDAVRDQALREKPKLIVAGASAYPRIIDFQALRAIADEVGALFMADIAHIAGLVATGLHPTPIGYAQFVTTTTHKTLRGPRGGMIFCDAAFAKEIDKAVFPACRAVPSCTLSRPRRWRCRKLYPRPSRSISDRSWPTQKPWRRPSSRGFRLVSGGTDNHLLLVDVKKSRGLTGKRAQELLDDVGVTANKNTIPFDEESPFVTSGVRLGTPALTTRGMKEAEMEAIAAIIDDVLSHPDDEKVLSDARGRVAELTRAFPLYAELARQ